MELYAIYALPVLSYIPKLQINMPTTASVLSVSFHHLSMDVT